MLMTAADYRDSLRAYRPRVFVNGSAVESVADEPSLAPGIAAVGVTYDFAHRPEHAHLMTALAGASGKIVNRMSHIDATSTDLLHKLEAVRLVCKVSGCAQRYLTHDALNGMFAATKRTDEAHGTGYHERFLNYLHDVQERDLCSGRGNDRRQRRPLKTARSTNQRRRLRSPHGAAPDGVVIRERRRSLPARPTCMSLS